MEQLWKVLCWSMGHMFFGKHPEKDHQGKVWDAKSTRKAVAGSALHSMGYAGCIFAISADGEFQQNEFRLPGSSHNDCCWSCKANKSDIPHNDYRQCALWRKTVVKHKGKTPTDHQISTVPGVNGYSFHYDTLHVLEEGIASHALANCLFDFIIKGEFEGSQEKRLKTVFEHISRLYVEHGIEASNRIRTLRLTNFCTASSKYTNFPELTGYKARHIRYLVPCILEMCQYKLDGKPYTKHRFECLQNLEAMYQCLESAGLHLSEKESQKFKKSTELCLLHYARLSTLSIAEEYLQWNTVHKHHLVAHMPDQARFLNPRFVSTYSGETMVGYMSALGHACLNGTPPHLVPEKVSWRFRLGMHLKHLHGGWELEEFD